MFIILKKWQEIYQGYIFEQCRVFIWKLPERHKDREPLGTDSCEVAVFASFGNISMMKIETAVRLNSGSGKGEIKGDECAPCQHTDDIHVIYMAGEQHGWQRMANTTRDWWQVPKMIQPRVH